MDIKEIALKHSREYLTFKLGGRKGLDVEEIVCDDEIYAEIVDELAQQFEALISAYKAELLKEAGEPIAVTNHAQLGYVTGGMHPDIPLAMWAKETSYSGANIALYTSDQLATAVLKATKPLEDQLAKAEQLWQVAQGRCDGLEEKLAKAEQRVAEACALTYLEDYDLTDIAERIRSGEWREFLKEEV